VTQFPGLHIDSERLAAESGDTVVTEIRLVNGDPASGHFRRQGTVCEISRVRDGRIVSCRSYYMAETGVGEDAASPGPSGSVGALPRADLVAQSLSPALADIIGARRARRATMISSGSIP
jgi:hypothetical protein